MFSLISTIAMLGSIIYSWQRWHSTALSVVIFIAVVMILRSLRPYIEIPWQRKHPPVQVDVLKDIHPETVGSNGVHFLIMTQEVFFNCKTQEDTDYLIELCEKYIEELMKDETFKYRYNYVQAKRYPIQYAYCGCGKSDFSVSTHYMRWMKSFGVTNMNGYQDKKDMFTIDDVITLPDETVHRVMFQALFDPKLPAPEEKKK